MHPELGSAAHVLLLELVKEVDGHLADVLKLLVAAHHQQTPLVEIVGIAAGV